MPSAVHAQTMIPIGEAARRLGVSVDTLRRWDREGRVNAHRTVGGQRRFAEAEIERLRSATTDEDGAA